MNTEELLKNYNCKPDVLMASRSEYLGRSIVQGYIQEIVARERFLEIWELWVDDIAMKNSRRFLKNGYY